MEYIDAYMYATLNYLEAYTTIYYDLFYSMITFSYTKYFVHPYTVDLVSTLSYNYFWHTGHLNINILYIKTSISNRLSFSDNNVLTNPLW